MGARGGGAACRSFAPRRGIAGDGRFRPSRGRIGPGLGSGACPWHEHATGALCGVRRGVLGGEAGRRYSSEESRTGQGQAEDKRRHGGFVTMT